MQICPNCGRDYPDTEPFCPGCGVRQGFDPVLLISIADTTQLGMAAELLRGAGIDFYAKKRGSDEYLQIVMGRSVRGTELYVDRCDLSRAEDAVGVLEGQEPFDEEALAEAAEAEPPARDEPERGSYRMFYWFLAAFGAFIAVLILVKVLLP